MTSPFALATLSSKGSGPFVALVINGRAVGLALVCSRYRGATTLQETASLMDLLQDWSSNFEKLCELAEFATGSSGLLEESGFDWANSDIHILPPVLRPSKMLYAAANYGKHVREMRSAGFTGGDFDTSNDPIDDRTRLEPYCFLKAPSTLAGAHDDIVLPAGMERIDWEVEMALAIGTPGKRIPAERAVEHIAGYMTTNDVSCRDLTWRKDRPTVRSDWLAGKSFDGFAPMGPLFVPRAFVPDHSNLRLWLTVNGETMQDGNTSDMTFSPDEQIEYVSKMLTLEPGDVFATGTPDGVGQGRGIFLKDGDVVEAEVEGLGRLHNRMVAESEE